MLNIYCGLQRLQCLGRCIDSCRIHLVCFAILFSWLISCWRFVSVQMIYFHLYSTEPRRVLSCLNLQNPSNLITKTGENLSTSVLFVPARSSSDPGSSQPAQDGCFPRKLRVQRVSTWTGWWAGTRAARVYWETRRHVRLFRPWPSLSAHQYRPSWGRVNQSICGLKGLFLVK